MTGVLVPQNKQWIGTYVIIRVERWMKKEEIINYEQ